MARSDGARGRPRTARALAAATPSDRERYVDLLRALSILVVLLGHWTIAGVRHDSAGLTWQSLLTVADWTHPVTWLVQVMPVFFLVGGYANAASWVAARGRGVTAESWLRSRALRLLRPAAVLLAVLAMARVVGAWWGADPAAVRTAVWTAAAPLWFLVVYLAVVLLAPAADAAHRRWGLAVLGVLVLGVALGDLARLVSSDVRPAAANYLLAWAAAHQSGIAWRHGALPTSRTAAWALVGAGLGIALFLVGPGPYGVAMVGAARAPSLTNTAPPTLALLALATAQLGAVLLLRDRATAWLARARVWTAVVAVNGVVFTLFLWHMAAVVIVGYALVGTGALPDKPIGSAAWWAWRPVWFVVVALVLGVLVAAARRWDAPVRAGGPVHGPTLALGLAALLGGLTALGVSDTRGIGPLVIGVPVLEVGAVVGGLVLVQRSARGVAGRP